MASPLEEYDTKNISRWEILSDIPDWEVSRLVHWIKGILHEGGYDRWSNRIAVYNSSVMASIQRRERVMFADLGVDISSWPSIELSLREFLKSDQRKFVLILELIVKYARDSADSYGKIAFGKSEENAQSMLAMLDNFLENGSKWRVVFDKNAQAGLAERASEELTTVARNLANTDLSDAWNYAYGNNPDVKLAIEKAQNAVEYYATKSGLTTVKSSVYGNLLSDIKNNPSKYTSATFNEYKLQDDAHKGENPDGTLNDMMSNWFWHTMNLVQKTNLVRHKNSENHEYVIPIEAARQAVLMATLLCEMIDKKYFTKEKASK